MNTIHLRVDNNSITELIHLQTDKTTTQLEEAKLFVYDKKILIHESIHR